MIIWYEAEPMESRVRSRKRRKLHTATCRSGWNLPRRKLDGYSYRALLTAAARCRNTVAAQRWFRRATREGEAQTLVCFHGNKTIVYNCMNDVLNATFACRIIAAWLVWFYMIEGSLEVKLPTIWTDEAAKMGRGREEKETEEKKSEKRKAEARRWRWAKR